MGNKTGEMVGICRIDDCEDRMAELFTHVLTPVPKEAGCRTLELGTTDPLRVHAGAGVEMGRAKAELGIGWVAGDSQNEDGCVYVQSGGRRRKGLVQGQTEKQRSPMKMSG